MRQVVNVGLVVSFLALSVTGILSFFFAFDIKIARLHFSFGFTFVLLVFLHVFDRLNYFSRFFSRVRTPLSHWKVLAILLVWLTAIGLSVFNLPPVSWLTSVSYEAQRSAEIFRPNPLSASKYERPDFYVRRNVEVEGGPAIEVQVEYAASMLESEKRAHEPAVAVWAETESGSLIETLYLTEGVAFSDRISWGGGTVPRYRILPIWRHRYTLVSGVDPMGDADSYTGATSGHSFSLDSYFPLKKNVSGFSLFLEINLPNDTSENSLAIQEQDQLSEILGQPSVIYGAYIDLKQGRKYHLLHLLGHSDGSDVDGQINYDLTKVGSAKALIEKIIVKIDHD